MRTKKHLIAIAILFGMLFTACTPESINTDDEQNAAIDKKKFKVPTAG